MDKYPLKKYPVVGACGLNCGLCPRYHTEGTSRCPGCCGTDFWQKHPSCGFITCCVKQRNLETCAQCADCGVCEKIGKLLDSAKNKDSFISYKPLTANFALIQKNGIEEFAQLEIKKQAFLRHLIDNYDEGRSKSFYCTSCQLIPLDKLKEAMADAETEITEDISIKEKTKIVRAAISSLADTLQIDLKLRR
ncbi:MAG TPA: DUF3795 domain-containing protein [Dehalococcoidia bacterium]|nr:DUF3795 domain-containing protein [Dehalococcoidia bacterium]